MSVCFKKCTIDAMKTMPVSTGIDQKVSIKFKFIDLDLDELTELICGLDFDSRSKVSFSAAVDVVGANRFVLPHGYRMDINFIGRMDPFISLDGEEVKGTEMSIPFKAFVSKSTVVRKYDELNDDFLYTVILDCEKGIDGRLDGELAYFLRRKIKRNKVTYEIIMGEDGVDDANS